MVRSKGKLLRWLSLLSVFLFSCAGSATAYLYGSSEPKTAVYASLMSVDSKVKTQKETDFLHGTYIPKPEETDKVDTYKSMLDYQRSTKFQYNFYNSFLVCSREGKYLDFSTDYGFAMEEERLSNLIQVATYYDKNFMESIGIPLFSVADKESRINPKNGADCGAYISASDAETIVKNNGYLAKTGGDLRSAFDLLLEDKEYVFSLSNERCEEGVPFTFSVNNIYIDPSHMDMLNDFQKQVQTTRYGDYNKAFCHWFPNAVFSFSYDIFSKGSSYVFDIRRNYGNIDRFFSNVLGYDYAQDGASVSLFKEDGTLFAETDTLNKASANFNASPNFLFLILSILSFATIGIGSIFLLKNASRLDALLFIGMPAMLFCFIHLIYYILLQAGVGILTLYQVINSTGNIICLVSVLAVTLFASLWRIYARKA